MAASHLQAADLCLDISAPLLKKLGAPPAPFLGDASLHRESLTTLPRIKDNWGGFGIICFFARRANASAAPRANNRKCNIHAGFIFYHITNGLSIYPYSTGSAM
jgi:hypothetical protein